MLGITPATSNCDKRVSFGLQQRALAMRFLLLVNYSTVLSFVSLHAVSHYCLVVSITNTLKLLREHFNYEILGVLSPTDNANASGY